LFFNSLVLDVGIPIMQ